MEEVPIWRILKAQPSTLVVAHVLVAEIDCGTFPKVLSYPLSDLRSKLEIRKFSRSNQKCLFRKDFVGQIQWINHVHSAIELPQFLFHLQKECKKAFQVEFDIIEEKIGLPWAVGRNSLALQKLLRAKLAMAVWSNKMKSFKMKSSSVTAWHNPVGDHGRVWLDNVAYDTHCCHTNDFIPYEQTMIHESVNGEWWSTIRQHMHPVLWACCCTCQQSSERNGCAPCIIQIHNIEEQKKSSRLSILQFFELRPLCNVQFFNELRNS